jgi:hypothetical protein
VSAVALTSVALCAVGILELILADYFPTRETLRTGLGMNGVGISSTLGSPIALATYLLIGVPCVLCSLTRAQTRDARDFWVAATTLCLLGILLTRHPAGLVALALIATAYLWVHFSTMWASVFLGVLTPFIYLSVAHGLAGGNLSWLQLLCGDATQVCQSLTHLPTRRLLFGVGPRTIGEVVLPDLGLSDSALRSLNGNVRLLLENGVLGWVAMLWILITAVAALYRAQRSTADAGLRAVLWAVMAAVLGFGVAMQSFDPFDNIAIQLLFWGLLGIGIGTVVRLGERPSDYRIALKLGH